MGAVGLNRAAQDEARARTSAERVASHGWARWTPLNAAAVATHLAGGAAPLVDNAPRVGAQKGVMASTVAKTILTAAPLAVTCWARVLGKEIELAVSDGPEDMEAAGRHPVDIGSARRCPRLGPCPRRGSRRGCERSAGDGAGRGVTRYRRCAAWRVRVLG